MFTLAQIQAAHSQVKSGADFPAYIQALKKLGVLRYEAFVSDGHVDYNGEGSFQLNSDARYPQKMVATFTDESRFRAELQAHQQGKTDYPTFLQMCAETGIVKWVIQMDAMTCTYFDGNHMAIVMEKIPE